MPVLNKQNSKADLLFPRAKYRQLPTSLTINTIAVDPMLIMYGSETSGPGWTPQIGATALAETGTGTVPSYRQQGTIGTGVKYSGVNGRYHAAAAASAYGIALEDFVIEVAFKFTPTTNAEGVLGKFSVNIGMDISPCLTVAAANPFITTRSGATSVTTTCANASCATGGTYLLSIYADRNEASTNSLRMYVNGVNKGAGNISGLAALTLDQSTQPLLIGTLPSYTPYAATCTVYYVGMWKQADWFAGGATNATDMDAHAVARYAALIA